MTSVFNEKSITEQFLIHILDQVQLELMHHRLAPVEKELHFLLLEIELDKETYSKLIKNIRSAQIRKRDPEGYLIVYSFEISEENLIILKESNDRKYFFFNYEAGPTIKIKLTPCGDKVLNTITSIQA